MEILNPLSCLAGAVNKIIDHIEKKGFDTKEIGLAWMEKYLKDVSYTMLVYLLYIVF